MTRITAKQWNSLAKYKVGDIVIQNDAYYINKTGINSPVENSSNWLYYGELTRININALENVVYKTGNQEIQGIKDFTDKVVIQDYKYSGDLLNDRIIISPKDFDPRFDRIQIIGNTVLKKLEYVHPDWTRRYVAMGNNLMWDFTGNTNYRPEHPAHDSIAVFGSNQGSGFLDGTNFTFFGSTNMWLNDVKYGDYVTVVGKGNTNSKGTYNDPNRVVVAESDGMNLRDILTNIAIIGNENWFGDVKDTVIIGNHNRLYKYMYLSTVVGSGNLARNQSGNPADPNETAYLDCDVIIGHNIWKDFNKYPSTHNLLIGVQNSFNESYRPLVEGNFKNPYFNINGKFKVNDGNVIVPSGNDGSTVIFSDISKDSVLKDRTFIVGKKNFNSSVFTHPLTGAGSFIGSGVNNFPIIATDSASTDPIDSITVYGQRNGLFSIQGTNIWTFGTAGHRQYANPMKDVVNMGVFGIGNGLTGPVIPTTPTSLKVLKYNELVVNLGNNYVQHAYNSLLTGYSNNNYKIVSDSIILGNGNSFSSFHEKDLDHSIIIGHNIYNESDYNDDERTNNWKIGINRQVFIKGHQGRGFKRTELFGVIILEDRLRLGKMTKTYRNALTNAVAGDLIWQTDAGNSGLRVYDGTNWLAVQTTIDN